MYNFEYNEGEAIGFEDGQVGQYQHSAVNPYKFGTKKWKKFEEGYTDGYEQASLEKVFDDIW